MHGFPIVPSPQGLPQCSRHIGPLRSEPRLTSFRFFPIRPTTGHRHFRGYSEIEIRETSDSDLLSALRDVRSCKRLLNSSVTSSTRTRFNFYHYSNKSTMPAAKVRSAASTIAALPPFPSDINTAPLFRVSLAKILAKDVDESARVLEACKTRK